MKPEYTIKPEYNPFVILSLLPVTAFILLLGVASTIFVQRLVGATYSWIPALLTLTVLVFLWLNRSARFNKTRTEFYKQRIIHYTGGLFSNHQTTLEIHNLTHIKLIHPFIRHSLYNTSNLHVQAAGSGAVEVHAQDFLHGQKTYEYLQERMQQNGFSLKRETLKQQENPSKAAIILKNIGFVFMFLFFIGPVALGALLTLGALGLIPLLLVVTAAGGLYAVFILDQVRREYDIYEDAIEYHEGFLTKKHSVLPAENLAEANNNQTFLDRILGVSNLVISTQGSGQTTFSNMPRGEQLEQTIDELAKAYQPLTNKQTRTPEAKNQPATKQTTTTTTNKKAPNTSYTGTYKQHLPRALISALLAAITVFVAFSAYAAFELLTDEFNYVFFALAAAFIFVVTGAKGVFEALFTTYEVRERGVYQQYELLQRRTQEFTDDKLVGIEIKRNVADYLLQTASITFQSLSSAPNITFKFQKNYQSLVEELQKKYYLNTTHEQTIHAEYKIRYFLTKNFLVLLSLAAALLVAASIASLVTTVPTLVYQAVLLGIPALILVYAATRIPRYYKSKLQLHEEHLEHTVGFFIQKKELVRYEDLKHQHATSYKLAPVGGLYLGIGGVSQAANKQQRQQVGGANGFLANYLPDTHALADVIDKKLLGSNQGFNQATKQAKPSLKNPSLKALLISIPTLGLSLLSLPVVLWRTSRFRYELEEQRVVEYKGVWNRTKHSVVYNNIDHLTSAQGFVNQIYKNGSVHIFTLGSSGAELSIRNVSAYKDWQQAIEEQYH